MRVSISRNGAFQMLTAKPGSAKFAAPKAWMLRSGDAFPFELPKIPRLADIPKAFMSWRSAVLRIEAESVDSQPAQFFGVREGVLVGSVLKGWAAEKAGLNVITKIDSAALSNSREICAALRSSDTKTPQPYLDAGAPGDKRWRLYRR